MAQSIQIVPKFSFPYVETVINDYTRIANETVTSAPDDSFKQAYAVMASKGIDNVWIKKTSRSSAEATFGKSNFKKYGQPLMQALHVLDQANSQVWMMRVMPTNATMANKVVFAGYKADAFTEDTDVLSAKFRVELIAKEKSGVAGSEGFTSEDFEKEVEAFTLATGDADEGYTTLPVMGVRYSGRGICGNNYSLRVTPATTYEKEYGIKMYNFEVINSEAGLVKEANYIGTMVSSISYLEDTTTLINDILSDVEPGVAPVVVYAVEENVEAIYDKYIEWVAKYHEALIDELAERRNELTELEAKDPEELTEDEKATILQDTSDIEVLEELIAQTEETELPSLEKFDILFGKAVGSDKALPGMTIVAKKTSDTETGDDYSTKEIVDFTSAKGLNLLEGTDGDFDPEFLDQRQELAGIPVDERETVEDIAEDCYVKAFNGTFDKKILSTRRMNITAFFDANYPFSVKETLAELIDIRNEGHLFLDAGIQASLSKEFARSLINNYSIFNSPLISIDIHNYLVRESTSLKKVRVTVSYFNAYEYINHVVSNGFHIPFVYDYAQLSGHIKDSVQPIISDWDNDIRELLYDNRFNYYTCIDENIFQRSVQNTTQSDVTDLLEESNAVILYRIKRMIEDDIHGQIYNFADSTVREAFVRSEALRFESWIGNQIESFSIDFSTSEYEFNRSILHCYVAIVFRGLTKKAIVEIDINKRVYSSAVANE